VPTGELPTWLLRMVAPFDRTIKMILGFVGRRELVSADKARRELGWTMRPPRDTFVDTANSLIELGLAPNPKKTAAGQSGAPENVGTP
jgi:hypothetical protein